MAEDETKLVERLRRGDEEAFRALVAQWHGALKRMARTVVADDGAADEIVQETWLAVIEGIEQFEQRSTLKTWIFSILFRRARSRARRDSRVRVWSSMSDEPIDEEIMRQSERFDARGRWLSPPKPWAFDPEDAAVRKQLLEHLERYIGELPDKERVVVMLRDVEGFDSDEVCDLLDIERGHQRVLLHRARVYLRDVLSDHAEEILGPGEDR